MTMISRFIDKHLTTIIIIVLILITLIILRYVLRLTINAVAKKNGFNEARISLVRRYINTGLLLLSLVLIISATGTDLGDVAVLFSSVFAVIGVGLFAVWSILSNITSGVIMFFSFPHKVGDKIKIHDSDFPFEAIIEDISTFHLHLRLNNGDLVTYPNNLMLQKAVTLVKKDAIDEDDQLTQHISL